MNNLGKARLWITLSPRDDESKQILFYALPPHLFSPCKDASLHFRVLSSNPVAAALQFERVLETLVDPVIGWDVQSNEPRRGGGLFGVPNGWLRIIEEQGRLSLHVISLCLLCMPFACL